jgi:hypothetical protein
VLGEFVSDVLLKFLESQLLVLEVLLEARNILLLVESPLEVLHGHEEVVHASAQLQRLLGVFIKLGLQRLHLLGVSILRKVSLVTTTALGGWIHLGATAVGFVIGSLADLLGVGLLGNELLTIVDHP